MFPPSTEKRDLDLQIFGHSCAGVILAKIDKSAVRAGVVGKHWFGDPAGGCSHKKGRVSERESAWSGRRLAFECCWIAGRKAQVSHGTTILFETFFVLHVRSVIIEGEHKLLGRRPSGRRPPIAWAR